MHHFGCLADNATMDHRLVIRLYRRCVVQNHDFGLEVKHRSWLRTLVHQNHAFSEVVSLQLVFFHKRLNAEADGLTSSCFVHFHSLVVNCPHLDWLELSRFIRAQQQLLVGTNSSR